MTEFGLPFDGILTGDAVRAPYSADAWSRDYTASVQTYASRPDYGVMKGYDDGVHYSLEVTQTGTASNQVELHMGRALVTGTPYVNDTTEAFTVQPNGAFNPRIDTLVIRKDFLLQTTRAVIKQGTPAASPVPPALTQTAIEWEIPIADIAVANGFSVIRRADITPRHEFINVGDGIMIDGVLNNSGDVLQTGDVVIWDSSAARAVTTTTVANHGRAAGVWQGRTANGQRGRVLQRGFALVRVRIVKLQAGTQVVPRGRILTTGYLARRATIVEVTDLNGITARFYGTDQGLSPSLIPVNTGFAPVQVGTLQQEISIADVPGLFDEFALVYVDVQQQRNPLLITAIGLATGTFTSGAFRQRALEIVFASNNFGLGAPIYGVNQYVSLSGNVLTLQPGLYYLRGKANAYRVDGHRVSLRLSSGTLAILVNGQDAYSPSASDSTQSFSETRWQPFACSVPTGIELVHLCETTRATDGFGKVILSGQGINSVVEIMRLGEWQ